MSATTIVHCDRCGVELFCRGARITSKLRVEGFAYELRTSIEDRGLGGGTDLCDACEAVILVQYARLIWQDLAEKAKGAKGRRRDLAA